MIQINVYKQDGCWFGARWIDGDYDGCDELDVPDGASAEAALQEAETMPLLIDGTRLCAVVSEP